MQYTANEFGMRDKERTLSATKPRSVILGDSIIEGWGNELPDRLSDQLETLMGYEVLNFGTSGGFGTIQEWQQYKHLVIRFSHDVVLFSILPHDDFKDNSLVYDERTQSEDYKPYLRGTYPDYALYYRFESLPQRSQRDRLMRSIDFTIREWSSFYRIMRYLGSYRIKDMKLVPRGQAEFGDKPERLSRYYEFEQDDWMIMCYTLEQMAVETKGKTLIVFTVPVYSDFKRYDGTEPPLARNLRELAEKNGFIYVDLLQEIVRRNIDYTSLSFVCDPHWNAYGNEVAAKILAEYAHPVLDDKNRASTGF